jgi:chemotaxis protein CheY-P-specific phosphatase CheC
MPEAAPKLQKAMERAVTTTLENMAFMEARALHEDHDCLGASPIYCANLLVLDPIQGELVMLMPEELLKQIAGNIYALPEEELSDRMLADLMSELLNTIAGIFLSALLPSDQTFGMGLPTISRDECHELEPPVERWHFQVDGKPFCFSAGGSAWQRFEDKH